MACTGITISVSFYFLFWSSNWCPRGPKAKFGKVLRYSQPKGQQEPYSTLSAKFALFLPIISAKQANRDRFFWTSMAVHGWKQNTNCRIRSKDVFSWTTVITTASVLGQARLSKEVWVRTVLVTESHLILVTLKLMGVLLLNSVEAELNPLILSSSTPVQKGIYLV